MQAFNLVQRRMDKMQVSNVDKSNTVPQSIYKEYLNYPLGLTVLTSLVILIMSQRVAKAKKLTGPYVKRRLPVLETDWGRYSRGLNTTWVGPGHGSVVSMYTL